MLLSNFFGVIKVFALIFLATNVICGPRSHNRSVRQTPLSVEPTPSEPTSSESTPNSPTKQELLCRDEVTTLFMCELTATEDCLKSSFTFLQNGMSYLKGKYFAKSYRRYLRENIRPGQVEIPSKYCKSLSDDIAPSAFQAFSPHIEATSSSQPFTSYSESNCLNVLNHFFPGTDLSPEEGGMTPQGIINKVYDTESAEYEVYQKEGDLYYQSNPDYPYIIASYVAYVADFSEYEGDIPSPLEFCSKPTTLVGYVLYAKKKGINISDAVTYFRL